MISSPARSGTNVGTSFQQFSPRHIVHHAPDFLLHLHRRPGSLLLALVRRRRSFLAQLALDALQRVFARFLDRVALRGMRGEGRGAVGVSAEEEVDKEVSVCISAVWHHLIQKKRGDIREGKEVDDVQRDGEYLPRGMETGDRLEDGAVLDLLAELLGGGVAAEVG